MTATAIGTITPSVTQDNIDNGPPRSANTCPVALAIIAALTPNYRNIRPVVRPGAVSLWVDGGFYYTAKLPEAATEFIEDLAAGRPVRPFSFPLTFS